MKQIFKFCRDGKVVAAVWCRTPYVTVGAWQAALNLWEALPDHEEILFNSKSPDTFLRQIIELYLDPEFEGKLIPWDEEYVRNTYPEVSWPETTHQTGRVESLLALSGESIAFVEHLQDKSVRFNLDSFALEDGCLDTFTWDEYEDYVQADEERSSAPFKLDFHPGSFPLDRLEECIEFLCAVQKCWFVWQDTIYSLSTF